MQRQHVKYLLIGGGVAATRALAGLRARDGAGAVMIVTRETMRPYDRTQLSKGYLQRKLTRDQLAITAADYFAKSEVILRTGRRAMQIDVARNSVTLDSSEEIFFDRLLIGIGGVVKPLGVPGASLPNVYYLRTLDDADRLANAIDAIRAEGTPHPGDRSKRGLVVVIGGGMLGVEVASSMRALGLHVELLSGRAHLWNRCAGESVARFVTRSLENNGVVVHNAAAVRLEGDGRVQRVIGSMGQTIEANLVVACVGLEVQLDLLRNTPIAAEKTILTDARGQTNQPNIYAAGDCAAVFDPTFGKHRHIDHWSHAALMGEIVGDAMAGGPRSLEGVTPVETSFFEHVGLIVGESKLVSHRIVRSSSEGVSEFGISTDGRLTQVVSVGAPVDAQQLCRLVERRVSTHGIEEVLRDPGSDLSSIG